MERPSHINFNTSHSFARRLSLSGLAITLPLAVLWSLTHDLVGQITRTHGPIVLVPVEKPVEPKTPPPLPKMEKIEQLKVEQPVFKIGPDQKDDRIAGSVAPQPPKQEETPTVGPDRPAAGIMSTHSIPPYPMLAQRLGEEGKVTLRLTVLPDGTVGKAEIVTSSGRNDLDEAARDWILAHWTYRPALEKGQAAVSQTTATVVFSLRDQR